MSITYTVLYRKHGDTTWITFGQTTLTTITVTGLLPSTQYDFEVQATNEVGSSTSNIVQTGTTTGVTFTSVVLSSQSFIAGSAIGTPVGTISVGMSSGSFTGNLALGGTDAAFFQIVGTALQLKVANTTARSYSISITASQVGVDNTPFLQTFPLVGNASQTESQEGFSVTAPGTSIFASTTMGSASPSGPWNQFGLSGPSTNQQVTLLAPGQSPITTTSGGVVKIIYHNHTCYQTNNAAPAGWWYWNTTLAFGASNWTEYGVSALSVTAQTYTLGAAVNTQVATISVTMLDTNPFNGLLTVTDPTSSFKIVGNAIQAAKVLSQTSYPNVTVTATPAVTTDGNAIPIGEPASQTVTISQTGAFIQVPLGVHVGLWLNDDNGSRSFWPDTTQHYTGFNAAMGRTATTVAMVGSNAATLGPDSGDAGSARQSAYNKTTTIPKLTLIFTDGSVDNDYAGWASGAHDAALTTMLTAWKNLGYTKAYMRVNWEFNDNFLNHGITSTSQLPTWISAWKRLCNNVHTFSNNNGIKIKMVWCPTCTNNANTGASLNQPIMSFFPQPDASAVNLSGQTTAPGTGFGKYIDVIGPDMYAFGFSIPNPFVTDPNTNINTTTGWYWNNYIKLAQQFGCSMAICELGDFSDNGGGGGHQVAWQNWIPNIFVPNLNTLKTLTPAVPIEFLAFFDLTESNAFEFSHPSDALPNELAGWKTAMGSPQTSGSITTIPAIW